LINSRFLVAAFLSISLFIISCSELKKSRNQGIIEYEVIYLDSEEEYPVIGLMPEIMTVSFNSKCSKSKMVGFLGFFSTQIISDTKERVNYTLIKIQGKKYVCKETLDDGPFVNNNYENVNIEYASETKEIAGFLCKKAIVTFPNDKKNPIEVFYTDEINFSDPNKNTPFAAIEGVLLEFQLKLYKINMKFVASEIQHVDIPKEEFEIPPDYEFVTKEKIEELINDFI
jgi:GLPGLI family protein